VPPEDLGGGDYNGKGVGFSVRCPDGSQQTIDPLEDPNSILTEEGFWDPNGTNIFTITMTGTVAVSSGGPNYTCTIEPRTNTTTQTYNNGERPQIADRDVTTTPFNCSNGPVNFLGPVFYLAPSESGGQGTLGQLPSGTYWTGYGVTVSVNSSSPNREPYPPPPAP
jgi:hypothetical protein